MHIRHTEELDKDLKKLCKKYPSILSDFEILKQVVIDNPTGKGASKHWNEISGISNKPEHISFYKVRMMCRSLRSSDLRVIYMYDGENLELLFIETYYKGSQENNDKNRIDAIVKNTI